MVPTSLISLLLLFEVEDVDVAVEEEIAGSVAIVVAVVVVEEEAVVVLVETETGKWTSSMKLHSRHCHDGTCDPCKNPLVKKELPNQTYTCFFISSCCAYR